MTRPLYCTTTTPLRCTTTPPLYCIAPPLHHSIAPPLHHSTVPPLYHSTCTTFHSITTPPLFYLTTTLHHSTSPLLCTTLSTVPSIMTRPSTLLHHGSINHSTRYFAGPLHKTPYCITTPPPLTAPSLHHSTSQPLHDSLYHHSSALLNHPFTVLLHHNTPQRGFTPFKSGALFSTLSICFAKKRMEWLAARARARRHGLI